MTDDPSGCTDWNSLAALYDSYRVDEIIMEWVPYATFDGNLKYAPIFVVFDPDSTSISAPSITKYLEYDNCAVMDLTKHWTYKVRPPKISSLAYAIGSAKVLGNGFLDIISPTATCAISYYSENLTFSEQYGTVIAHYKVSFASRR